MYKFCTHVHSETPKTHHIHESFTMLKWCRSSWPTPHGDDQDVRKSTDRFCPLVFWNTEMFTSQRYVRINPRTHVHSEKPKTRYIRNPLWRWSGLGHFDPDQPVPIKFPFWELDFSCLLFLCKKDQYLVAHKYQLVILSQEQISKLKWSDSKWIRLLRCIKVRTLNLPYCARWIKLSFW